MKEVLINSTSLEIRIAIVEDGDLVEFMIQREQTRRLVGDVYLGRVNAILPGIQASFVDIGYEKAGFLHASDLHASMDALAQMEGGIDLDESGPPRPSRRRRDSERSLNRGSGRGPGRGRRRDSSRGPKNGGLSIEKMLHKGQEILVQVTKEAIGTKGPRLSTQISLPGRYVVYMPNMDYLGVSRRIESREERGRLKSIISKKKPANCAIIARTACEGIEEKQIESDISYLHRLWQDTKKRSEKATAPSPIHEEVGLLVGMVRDIIADDVDRIQIDSEKEHRELMRYLRAFSPQFTSRVKLYKDKTAMFDKYNVEAEIEKSLERKVWLKKGGYLIFDHTEALVAVDVNTGRFVGKKDQEETILETNLLAAREVPRQLRLRDIGGIIVIDFIDMEVEANKKKVLAEIRHHLRKDRSRAKAFAISDLGLVEISRKRVRPSLLHFLSEECPYCNGIGKVLSFESLAIKIERWIRRVGAKTKEKKIQIRANSSLAIYLEEERSEMMDFLSRRYKMKIEIQDDPRLHREDFKVISLSSFRDLAQDLT
ncbi:MAG: Rne/Rng family ribonuclease [Candidatus Krumholzibacteria bacterium]|nr:Rne/Rng family ribonuclease [Candidatus Krumholzibacteria bacterium]